MRVEYVPSLFITLSSIFAEQKQHHVHTSILERIEVSRGTFLRACFVYLTEFRRFDEMYFGENWMRLKSSDVNCCFRRGFGATLRHIN